MSGVYIHIPFCNYKCTFCDFHSGNQLYLIDSYVKSLISEIELRKDYLDEKCLRSIYFGGGTPSLLTAEQLGLILNKLQQIYCLSDTIEITLECNPEDINKSYIDELNSMGINRISLGIQTLRNDILHFYGRNHTREDILNALRIIEDSSINNLSVDIMYDIPDLTSAHLMEDLEVILKFDIQHISAYSLTISNHSKLYWINKSLNIKKIDENSSIEQYLLIHELLRKNDLLQYEISNFSKVGFQSVHNSGYWKLVPYLGVGTSSHSYNLKSRQWNHKNIKKYIRELEDKKVSFDIELLSRKDKYNEYIMLSLRTVEGISTEYIQSNFEGEIYSYFRDKYSLYSESFLQEDIKYQLLKSDFLARLLLI